MGWRIMSSNNVNIEDKKLSQTVISIIVILTVQYLVLLLIGENNLLISRVSLFSKVILALMFISSLHIVFARRLVYVLITYSVAVFVILLNVLFFPVNQDYIISILFPFLFISLPCFLYVMSISNIEIFMSIAKKGSWIITIVGIIIGILVFSGQVSIGVYNMGFSYYLLLPAVMFTFDYLENKNVKSLFVTGILLLLILALGARGPLLSLISFYILYHIIDMRKKKTSSIIKILLMVLFISIGLIYYKDLLISINRLLLNYGIRSRSISVLLADEIVLSNRNFLYHDVINSIMEHPMIGVGIAGDRVILNGLYVHNVFLEIFSSFGVVVGFILSIALVLFLFRSLFKLELNNSKIILIWSVIGFVPLLVSSSFLIFYQFWIFIGIAVNISFGRKKQPVKTGQKT